MNGTLLWVDDEIELLKAYVIFLEKKEYEVVRFDFLGRAHAWS